MFWEAHNTKQFITLVMKIIINLLLVMLCIPIVHACVSLTDLMDPYGMVRLYEGEYTICSGNYGPTAIVIMERGVHLTCNPHTTISGVGEMIHTTWTMGVSFPLGEYVQADFTMEGCTFENYMVGVAGFEIDEDEQHSLHLTNGSIRLVNNTFNTPYSLFWCSSPDDSVYLRRNNGGNAVLNGFGIKHTIQNTLEILYTDPTQYNHDECVLNTNNKWQNIKRNPHPPYQWYNTNNDASSAKKTWSS